MHPFCGTSPNMALDLAPFGRWTLRDKAAQRRSALRYASGELTVLGFGERIALDLSSNLVRHRSLSGILVRFQVGKEHSPECFLPTSELSDVGVR